MSRWTLWIGATLTAALVVPLQGQQLGHIDFPATGSDEARGHFIQGVLLLHSFEYGDAAEAFRRARYVDPDFVMAYWGEAQTFNHPVWMRQDRESALRVLDELATTPSGRLAKAKTERERDWLQTVEILYGPGTKEDRDFAYRDAMRRLWEKYPADQEAATFYALSILGTAHQGRDFATYMQAAAVAQPVFLANPDHPGAAHYVIHAFDDPVHAPLGLPAARAYSEIAPDAGHAQHMTSHIFVAMGLWDDVVAANIRARDVQDAGRAGRGLPGNGCGHYTSWLHYGYLQQGRMAEAAEGMAVCQAQIEDGSSQGVGYYVAMRARAVFDVDDWEAGDRWSTDLSSYPGVALRYDFVDAVAAIRRGNVEKAQALRDRYGAASARESPRDGILLMELDGLLALMAGHTDDALRSLTAATEVEESLPYEFGPPATLMPPHELLAQTLAGLDRPEEARGMFEAQLLRTPRRTASLLGLARSASKLGDELAAREAYEALSAIWHRANGPVPGLNEVRTAVETEEGAAGAMR